jgi:signal transduction histidine kinase
MNTSAPSGGRLDEFRGVTRSYSEVRHELLAARRELERNLHDGAQQRLVALALDLKLVQARIDDDPRVAARLLAHAREELALAIEELRELAQGLHPPVLRSRGLRAALEALAERAPMPVRLEAPLAGRLPEPVETAAYYLVAEALTNAAKHAHAPTAHVRVSLTGERVRVEIRDDGVGGAAMLPGGGLRGLAERLEALGGVLEIDSAPGAGTALTGVIPLDPS